MGIDTALQLYSLRHHAEEDFPGMLGMAADAGYDAVEFAGFGGLPATELRSLLDHLGLRAVSAHVPYASLAEDPGPVIADLTTLGCAHAVVPGLPAHLRTSEHLPDLTSTFNRLGALCRDAGLRFGYHNHAWELAPSPDARFLDVLADATDPSLVNFQLDVYWALVAGIDPSTWIRAHEGRVPTLHAKELAAAGEHHHDTTVGDGLNDWPSILAAARRAGTEWLIVEQEDDQSNLPADIARSLANARRLIASHTEG